MSIIHDFADIARRMNQNKAKKPDISTLPESQEAELLAPGHIILSRTPLPQLYTNNVCTVCKTAIMKRCTDVGPLHRLKCDNCGYTERRVQCGNCTNYVSIEHIPPQTPWVKCPNCSYKINF